MVNFEHSQTFLAVNAFTNYTKYVPVVRKGNTIHNQVKNIIF